MTYQTIKLADTSPLGVNSSTAVSGTGWATVSGYRIFTGAGEQNDYTYAGVNLQSEKAGSLTFEFSQDGTNWSKYPVTEFSVAANINEVHGAWKGTRWIRPVFTQLSGAPQPDYFRLRTMYSDVPITLTVPLNQAINSDQDASVVRSIAIGEGPTGTYQNEKTGGLAFSTSANLSAGQVYQTDVLDLRGYTQVETHIQTDAEGTLKFEFLSTPSTVVRTLNVPYAPSAFRTFAAPAFTPYVRYTFTATTSSSEFYYDTKFTTTSINGQILALEDFISPAMVANLGRNVIVGKKPGANNLYSNVAVDSESRLNVSLPKTAFGEMKVANSTPLFQTSFPYNINTRIWNESLSGTASITVDTNMAQVSAGASSSYAKLESKKSMRYRPGQGTEVRFSALFTEPSAGSTQSIGIGTETDGFFFTTSGDQYAVERRRGGVYYTTLQSDWNLDKCDGTQVLPTIDFTKGNVFQIEYQWLGFGVIIFGLEDPVSGEIIPVHRIQYPNSYTEPSTLNPRYPILLDVTNTSNNNPIVLRSGSVGVFIEGDVVITGPKFASNVTQAQNNDDEKVISGIVNQSTFFGQPNNIPVFVKKVIVTNANTSESIIKLYSSENLTGLGLSSVDANDSVMQYVFSSLPIFTPSTPINNVFAVAADTTVTFDLDDEEISPGQNIILTSTGTAVNASQNITVAFQWREDV